MKETHVQAIRGFNRFYTGIIGLLDKHILNNRYTLPEARVLYELYHGKNLTARDLMTTLTIDKGYLSRILAQFEKRKLVSKTPSANDGRAAYLSLTSSGRKEFEVLDEASNKQLREILENLPEKDRIKLVQNMSAIKTILSKAQQKNI